MAFLSDLIEKQRQLQREFGYPIDEKDIATKASLLKDYSIAALDEIHESMAEFSWKTWASDEFINRDSYISELADEVLFLINRLIVVDCSENEFIETIYKKIDKNVDRLSHSYKQRDRKCDMCRRALDDHFSIQFIEDNNVKLCKLCTA